MPWAVAAAVVGVAGSAYVADKQADRQEELQAKQEHAVDSSTQMAEDAYKRYIDLYGGLEEDIANGSRDFASEANKTKAAQEAAGTVASSYAGLRDRLRSTPGLDPSSDRYLKEVAKIGVKEAADSAAAQTGARRNVEAEGQTRKLNAMSLGKGLPATAASGLYGAAGAYGQMAGQAGSAADRQAAGFGMMVGDIFNNKQFQNNVGSWWNRSSVPSNSAAAGTPLGAQNDGFYTNPAYGA